MDLAYFHHHRANIDQLPEAEDTAFYANLTRQILLLMDEDDETYARINRKNESPEFQGRVVVTSGNYFSSWEGGRNLEVPSWMERLWASNGAGTGVFIPRVVATGKTRRRRHNKVRRNDERRMRSYAGQQIHG
ncbi:hypothetical protein L2E82_13872 [Cichorium intybus]|uniref:Uncharacterized protein n=1 Tax=Cichorium intybus TaxID=13427 RepID=A0ACB9EY35_CICIN|nr:hypothetical protein L2E82_13872 [Cichorium intybus]